MQRTQKKDLIKNHQIHQKDTGSSAVQIAVLTARILELTEHLKGHPKDKSCRRGLIGLVSKRRSLLNHLKQKDMEVYRSVVKTHSLRAS